MKCDEARDVLLRDRRSPARAKNLLSGVEKTDRAAADEHLATCSECQSVMREEAALDATLARLPREKAPASLRALLESGAMQFQKKGLPNTEAARALPVEPSVDSTPPARPVANDSALAGARPEALRPRSAWRRNLSRGAVLVALAASVLVMVRFTGTAAGNNDLVREAVNDHLRELYSEHPVEIESGGIHQVKPWFAGRVDFAPALAYAGDEDFVLIGGAVGYMTDRKAAVFLFKHKLHQISLFVFRAEGMPWPSENEGLGRLRAHTETTRGFHVVTWRENDLGYVLVSDVDAVALKHLAERIVDPPPETK